MIKNYRSLVLLSMLKLNERELKDLHRLMNEINLNSFIELIRDTEDEVANAALFSISSWSEQPNFNQYGNAGLYDEVDAFRKRELKMTVSTFAEALSFEFKKTHKHQPFPKFDSRKGLRVWITKLSREFSESEIFHLMTRIKIDDRNKDSDWQLR